jgi:anti-sigma regulatory factor (Ser/Thr protein kinase)
MCERQNGYRDSAGGPVEVRAAHRDHTVTVTVTDFGTWKRPDRNDTYRGRGLPLIETLSDASAMAHRDDGTTVTMSWNLRPDPLAAVRSATPPPVEPATRNLCRPRAFSR